MIPKYLSKIIVPGQNFNDFIIKYAMAIVWFNYNVENTKFSNKQFSSEIFANNLIINIFMCNFFLFSIKIEVKLKW